MNNNKRRLLERRRLERRDRSGGDTQPRRPEAGADPLRLPLVRGDRCAVCARQPASTRAEIHTAKRGSLVFPVCSPCAKAMPALISRLGFARCQREIEQRMIAAETTPDAAVSDAVARTSSRRPRGLATEEDCR